MMIRLDMELNRKDTLRFDWEGGVYSIVPLEESLLCGLYSSPGRIVRVRDEAEPSYASLLLLIATLVLFATICVAFLVLRKTRSRKNLDSTE